MPEKNKKQKLPPMTVKEADRVAGEEVGGMRKRDLRVCLEKYGIADLSQYKSYRPGAYVIKTNMLYEA
ncbi:hypothetical protein HanPI659440_Chr03g0115061 [Helianthus annuus]|nr:hypothetical protein HanPI659440_Chr03g0115061 [Helianthus annuus]